MKKDLSLMLEPTEIKALARALGPTSGEILMQAIPEVQEVDPLCFQMALIQKLIVQAAWQCVLFGPSQSGDLRVFNLSERESRVSNLGIDDSSIVGFAAMSKDQRARSSYIWLEKQVKVTKKSVFEIWQIGDVSTLPFEWSDQLSQSWAASMLIIVYRPEENDQATFILQCLRSIGGVSKPFETSEAWIEAIAIAFLQWVRLMKLRRKAGRSQATTRRLMEPTPAMKAVIEEAVQSHVQYPGAVLETVQTRIGATRDLPLGQLNTETAKRGWWPPIDLELLSE